MKHKNWLFKAKNGNYVRGITYMNINVKECLEKARKAKACKKSLKEIKRAGDNWRDLPRLPYYLYWYADVVVQGRWSEAESYIAKDPEWSYWYAHDIVKGRWLEGESIIAKDPEWSFWYAHDIVKGRWPGRQKKNTLIFMKGI